jgi:cell division transport system permease protein
MNRLLYLINDSVKALFRAKVPALISSFTISITLIVFSLAYFTYINLVDFSYRFKEQYQIEVFFFSDISHNEAIDTFNDILLIDGVEQGEFIDKDKASSIFKNYFKEDIVQIIGTNPLPMGGSFEIDKQFRNQDRMFKITKKIRQFENVETASFKQGMITRIDKIVKNVLAISLLVGFSIFIVAIILVSNTIRLIIHAKQTHVETLHLLGATNSFIRFPFIFEGVLQGLIGALLSIFILYMFNTLQLYISETFNYESIFRQDYIIILNVILGMLLGFIGSYRGISKYLR